MNIKLSDHFPYGRLLRFTLPSIAMMIFTSIYGVVDGFFVSNFAGKTPFAAVNLIMPVLMIVATVGFMFGTGGTAIVAKVLDAVLIPLLPSPWKLTGAAIATAMSQVVSGTIPLFYFSRENNSILRLGRTQYESNSVLLPLLWGIDGIWASIAAADAMAVLLAIGFLIRKQKKYHY